MNKQTGSTEEAKHYIAGTLQQIEIQQENLSPEQFIGFLRGNALKYLIRMGRKNSTREDAGKAKQYVIWLCDALDGKRIIPGGK
ncbi:DUF3310 domain-containing protein [Pelosinus sp. IPA-1]|uniref:DUF3310 domain-containing protein n=1 Tax=Pelosinus sp. IPA-1 TaxID=3029569 RepID=UPI0024361DB4|nr:DUF3310 domain-containing protein [Pelosinus sp. IPA-1]GMB00901.1 hypothetical protein PIPA1_37000 [Pelosinus sp. IPA-1]